MIIEDSAYVPTLAVRPSEMRGLEFLPGATKDRMTPCFLLAPWANSHSLERTITRIERAFPHRNYFLDIDRYYDNSNPETEAQHEMAHLTDSANCFENWVGFVKQHERIWPCIQTRGQSETEIRTQIHAFQSLGRSYCMRIVRDRFPDNIGEIVDAFAAGGTADFAIILEGGWTKDPLSLYAWFHGLVSGSIVQIDATVPVVLSCTSFPKGFSEYSAEEPNEVQFTNRQLVTQVAGQSNRTRIIYGDWGSTRPRESTGYRHRPIDRVDYPTNDAWHISRNDRKNEDDEYEWDFRDAALAIVNSPDWDDNLGIWGEEMISETTINKDLGINTPQKNVAARVNIHLHRQAFYNMLPLDLATLEEDWQDD